MKIPFYPPFGPLLRKSSGRYKNHKSKRSTIDSFAFLPSRLSRLALIAHCSKSASVLQPLQQYRLWVNSVKQHIEISVGLDAVRLRRFRFRLCRLALAFCTCHGVAEQEVFFLPITSGRTAFSVLLGRRLMHIPAQREHPFWFNVNTCSG